MSRHFKKQSLALSKGGIIYMVGTLFKILSASLVQKLSVCLEGCNICFTFEIVKLLFYFLLLQPVL